MNLQRVNALIESTINTFETMLSLHVDAMAPTSKLLNASDDSGVIAIVGFNGDLNGSIVVSIPMACAKRLASVFTGTDASDNADEVCDVLGELAGMIAEGAISQVETGVITCSCPSVVIEAHQAIAGSTGGDRFVIPFSCECGEFSIAMSICRDAETTETSMHDASIGVVIGGATS